MKQRRRHIVRPLDVSRGDLSPYEVKIVDGKEAYAFVPEHRCITIDNHYHFSVDWLPKEILPQDTDKFCQEALRWFKRKIRDSRRFGACERYVPKRSVV